MIISAHKQFAIAAHKAAGEPTAEQLALVNRYALRELKSDEVYIRSFYLAHNAIDRDREVFDDSLLDDFVRTLPGKGAFVKHPGGWDGDSGPGEGRWIAAKVVEMSLDEARAALREPNLQWPATTTRAKLLDATMYALRLPSNADLLAKVDGGIAGDVSIGFRAADRTAITDAAGNEIARRLHSPGEALEGSLVWLGAQPGARAHKQASIFDEEKTMQLTPEQSKKLQDDLAAAKKATSDLQAKATAFDALAKEIGEELAKNPAALKALLDEAKAYHDEQLNEVVRLERLAGMVTGDDEKSVNAAKTAHAGRSAAWLRQWAAKLAKTVPGGGQLKGGDPNAGQGAQPATKDADPANPLNNPAITGAAA